MPDPLSINVQNLKASETVAISNEAKRRKAAGEDVLDLGVGEPDFDTPAIAAQAGSQAIQKGLTRYPPNVGIAEHYNRLYRRDKSSQYTIDNVAVASGGRLALSRCATALSAQRLGYFTPDYTAYEDLLTTFPRIEPVWIQLREEDGFHIDPALLSDRAEREELDALLISNPCNPTGVVIEGDDLRAWVDLSRDLGVTLLLDEFYSHYLWSFESETP